MNERHAMPMRAAIAEARRALGACHPNPAVGAVVVHQGEIVAAGHTQAPGQAHAEVRALTAFEGRGLVPDDSTTLYITLEPCSTHGRTPPCTDRILGSGIRRVVVGATDPNPAHAGRAFELLRAAGLRVETGVLAEDCAAINPVFHHWMRHGTALFAGKIATTLDGKVATRTGHSRWITGEPARQDVARWRRAFPGIAVGGGTILRDDPQLTARVAGESVWCPRRIVFDRAGLCLQDPAEQERKVFSDEHAHRTIYVTSEAHRALVPGQWFERGVELWAYADWNELRERCLDAEITGLYVEGGPRLLSDLLRHRALDYLFAYRAPQWLGDGEAPGPFFGFSPHAMADAFSLRGVLHESIGADQLVHGHICYPEEMP